MQLAVTLDRSPMRFGTEDRLSHSEIHLIEIIGETSGSSVTDLAKLLGITKGAVSQTLKKLEAKGYTMKEPHPENLSKAVVSLTSRGQTAYWAHKDWHERMDGGFSRYLTTLNDQELATIQTFLERTEDFLQRRAASRE